MGSPGAATAPGDPPQAASPLDRVGVIIPTWRAEPHWPNLFRSLSLQGIRPGQVLVIDSSSPDRTRDLASASGYQVVSIPREEFGHGKTRQAASSYFPQADLLLYMTQDAVLTDPCSVQNLCSAFQDTRMGAAYGRQLPRPQAGAIERHARQFNYPAISHVRTFESRHTLGLRAAFLSNSFAMYRREALSAIGGFPPDVIFGEDSYVAAKLLIAGWKVAYQAEATATHSHALSLWQEFSRYFDIGVHHSRERWLLDTFGHAEGEGKKFFLSEIRYLLARQKALIPLALARTACKLCAYRLGRQWRRLPHSLNRRVSSNSLFWDQIHRPHTPAP